MSVVARLSPLQAKQDRGVNHGTFLHIAHEEGLIRNTSIHAGIRAPLIRKKGDLRNDVRCGFDIVRARDIDRIGVDGVIQKLKERVAGTKVYISVDIDVLDPAFAPGTCSLVYFIEKETIVGSSDQIGLSISCRREK